MKVDSMNLETYVEKLEEFLVSVSNEIEMITRPTEHDNYSIENLDHYLLEVNSFYYRSFHESFIAEYKRDIQEEITHLLGLKIKENLVKKHVAAAIKRYTGLYNQVKKISAQLQLVKLQIINNKSSLIDEADRQILELVYGLKEIREKISALKIFLDDIIEISMELEKFQTLTGSRMLMMAAKSLCSERTEDPNISSSYYQLLKQQRQIVNLIQKCAAENSSIPERIHRIRSLLSEGLDSPAAEFNEFYRYHILSISQHYTELMALNFKINNRQRLEEIISEFEEFHKVWVTFFDTVIPYISRPAFDTLPELYKLKITNPGYIEELHKDVSSSKVHIEQIGTELDATLDIDFKYFCSEILNMLEFSAPLYKTIANESPVSEINLLASHLQQISSAFSIMDSRIRILNQEYLHISMILTHDEKLLTLLNSELDLLGNIKNDLERLLAPRNITRVWKDFDIRITHIPLSTGLPVPDEYLYLLDKHNISTRINDQMDNIVLHEEGDIFIIKVDDEIIEEIPYIVISKKG